MHKKLNLQLIKDLKNHTLKNHKALSTKISKNNTLKNINHQSSRNFNTAKKLSLMETKSKTPISKRVNLPL